MLGDAAELTLTQDTPDPQRRGQGQCKTEQDWEEKGTPSRHLQGAVIFFLGCG